MSDLRLIDHPTGREYDAAGRLDDLFKDGHWCQGSSTRMGAHGREYDILGAIDYVCGEDLRTMSHLIKRLTDLADEALINWNDDPNRKLTEVQGLVYLAMVSFGLEAGCGARQEDDLSAA